MTRTVFVTGASSGIGRAIAIRLLQQNHIVIGSSRDCHQFKVSQPNFIPWEMDLSQLHTLPVKAHQLQQAYPHLNTLIFAAGYGQFGALEQFSYRQIETLMTVNFTSIAFLSRALLPSLKKQARADIIFIGSEAALKGSRKGSIYCASKFALRGFSQALREECAKSQVKVGLINPGMVKTEFFNGLDFAPGDERSQHLTADDVADAVLYMLNSHSQIVVDEINLNPLHKVVQFKKNVATDRCKDE